MPNTITWKETRFLKVPLTPEEVRARGEQLAGALDDAEKLDAEHKAERDRQKVAMGALEGRIHHLGRVIREGVEERSVEVEMRVDLGLRLVEEVRLDTGEIVQSRSVTEDDQVRARLHLQTEIPGMSARGDDPA